MLHSVCGENPDDFLCRDDLVAGVPRITDLGGSGLTHSVFSLYKVGEV